VKSQSTHLIRFGNWVVTEEVLVCLMVDYMLSSSSTELQVCTDKSKREEYACEKGWCVLFGYGRCHMACKLQGEKEFEIAALNS
jgi:hypothetical protein